jgi:transketolase
MNIAPVADKWRAFGWHVLEVDGHDFPAVLAALDEARKVQGKPTMIVAHTTKGKGVSFMEDVVDYHGKVPTRSELDVAVTEIERQA